MRTGMQRVPRAARPPPRTCVGAVRVDAAVVEALVVAPPDAHAPADRSGARGPAARGRAALRGRARGGRLGARWLHGVRVAQPHDAPGGFLRAQVQPLGLRA